MRWLTVLAIASLAACPATACPCSEWRSAQKLVEQILDELTVQETNDLKKLPRSELLISAGFGLGLRVRNTWMEPGTCVRRLMAAQGLDAESGSHVVVVAVWQQVNGQAPDFEQLVGGAVKRLEHLSESPGDWSCPDDPAGELTRLHRELSRNSNDQPVVRQFAYCRATQTFWVFSAASGWVEPSREELEFLKSQYSLAD